VLRKDRQFPYSHDQINTTGYGYRAKLSLVKIEHPIVTGKGGRMPFVSDNVMGLHEAYKSN
jgi:hypothetical protein